MNDKTFLDELNKTSNAFNEAMKEIENQEEAWWNSLTEDERINAFCCVSRRIYQGDVKEKRSFRGILYDICQFGPEAYVAAQHAGYLTIHNLIGSGMDYENMCCANKVIVESDAETFELDFGDRTVEFSYDSETKTLTIKKKPLSWFEQQMMEKNGEK